MDVHEFETKMLQEFGDKYLGDVVRILNTHTVEPTDRELIDEGLSILVGMYTTRLRSGEISKYRIVH